MSSFEPEFIVPASPPAHDEGPATEQPAAQPPPLQLREPLPPVVQTPEELAATCDAIADTPGPVALDAERASGYRYSQRAYLVQLRREGAGTHLVDPIAFDDLGALDAAIGDSEWILHAATQDLPCLAEVGMHPRKLFDTELAGRLLHLPRVGLATLVEHFLGRSLAKEHSAADWSTRPLPESWLIYAALDVEVLVELREVLDEELTKAGKREWAAQDFEALLSFTGPAPKLERWRRTSGLHRARGRRTLALVRSLWETREAIARERDVTPGRILPDAAIVEIAMAAPESLTSLTSLKSMRGRGPRRFVDQWQAAVETALTLPEAELPTASMRHEGPPPARAWADKFPDAALRLGRCRDVVTALAEEHDLPTENLISPHALRQLAWEPPPVDDVAAVAQVLRDNGARPWQVDIVSPALTEILT